MNAERRRIDWAAVRERLERSRAALEESLTVSPEQLEAVYAARAVALAARRERAAGPAGRRAMVFELGTERYALDFNDIAEVLPFAACTRVPGGPPELLGVMNVRGEIRSVVDLGRLLALPERAETEPGYVLLVRRRGREAVVRVDRVEGVRSIDPNAVAAAGEGELVAGFLRGATPERLRLLSTPAVLAHPVFEADAEDSVAEPRP